MTHFPFTYKGELVFYKPDEFNVEIIQKDLGSKEIQIQSLFYFKTKVKTTVFDDNVSINIAYYISLFEQNIIFLFFVLFAVFFYVFNANAFSTLSIISGGIFYLSNLMYVSKHTKLVLSEKTGLGSEIEESLLWKKQQEWMKNNTLCPACGEPKNSYSNKCVNCGIYFSKKAKNIDAASTTSGQSFTIDYKKKP